jgi:septal ring factor EnvC (AmiA/AmiB activator)
MDFESLIHKKDGSQPSFHTTRSHALQRDNGQVAQITPPQNEQFNAPTPLVHPLISEVFNHLSANKTDPLTQSWTTISEKTDALSAELDTEAELKKRLAQTQQRINSLKCELATQLQDAQKAADQLLSAATLRAEVSRLTYNKLSERLNLNPA